MGMNEQHPPAGPSLDDLAVFALDAHDPAEERGIAAYLDTVPGAARWERTLRDAAGELGAAAGPEAGPPADLAARVRRAAIERRPPAPTTTGASPIEVHRVELSRAVLLLSDLRPGDWARPVDPPEFAGWTVHDVAVHVMANESLLADRLGDPVPGVVETRRDNEGRTADAQARHRGLPPAAAIVELEAAAEAVDNAVAARGPAGLDDRIEWWGGPSAIRVLLLVRAFEAWTHSDDIRRALGMPEVPPPPRSMITMASRACGFVPSLLAVRGAHHPGRVLRVRFPDLDPVVAWDVDLGVVGSTRPAGDRGADAELTMTALEFCRGLSARLPRDGAVYEATGDTALADQVVDALPALAFL
jgi:uncharacterized protein (TIGR03083 family)